jgi:hypothetical protein
MEQGTEYGLPEVGGQRVEETTTTREEMHGTERSARIRGKREREREGGGRKREMEERLPFCLRRATVAASFFFFLRPSSR